MKNVLRKLCVFPNDSLLSYFQKGEIKNGYFNPGNFFDEIHVISLFDDEVEENDVKQVAGNALLKIHRLGKANLKNYKKFESKVLKLISEINPVVIRAYNPLVQGWLALKIRKKLNIPLVISLHTNYEQQRKNVKNSRKYFKYFKLIYAAKKWEKKVLKSADAVICVYDFIVPYAKKMGARNISVIYNKVDLEKFSPQCTKKFELSKPMILSVGRLIDQKDHSIIIKSVIDLNVELLIVGDGPNYLKLINLIKKLKIQDRVKIIKKIPHEDLNRYYVSCSIYAQPMINLGGIPIPVLEAMASGLPIVMSKKEGNEIIDDAVLFVENEPNKFKNAFKEILANNELKNSLIEKGLNIINEIHSGKMENQEIELYKKLIKENNCNKEI